MFPNLKAEISRHNLSYEVIGNKIGKKREWVEVRVQGKATLPIDVAMEIREEFFPKIKYSYLYSRNPINPYELHAQESAKQQKPPEAS